MDSLPQREAHWDVIFQNAAAMIAVTDGQGRFVQVNPSVREMLGYTSDELCGMSYTDTTHPDDVEASRREVQRLSRGEVDHFHIEKRYLRKDGSVFWGAATVSGVYDAAGKMAALVAIVIDINDRKRAEEEARAAEQRVLELQRREKELAEAELERLRAQVVRQTQLATIGRVAGGIAHDLRNPLGIVRNAAFFLKRKVPPDEPKLREYLTMIEQETAAADRIIGELVALSQGGVPAKKNVALGAILTEARSRVAAFPKLEWETAFPDDPFLIDADAAQMEQVFRNLFANAIHALGGRGKITVAGAHRDQNDEIVVSDTGPGIAPDIRPRIFEPLFTTRNNGSGLGLTICQQIVERHGGTLELLENAPGAAFRIRLPRN